MRKGKVRIFAMADDLFPNLPETLSPKLSWLRKHGLVTSLDDDLDELFESPETGDICFPWLCGKKDGDLCAENTGGGRTEDEAILNYCEKTGTKHWSLEIL